MDQRHPRKWGDKTLLGSVPNPSPELDMHHEISHTEAELTFFGEKEQPDHGRITIEYVASKKCIELRSLKRYLQSFRQEHVSYERLVAVVFADITEVFLPKVLRVSVSFAPRGGLTSRVWIDSREV